MIYNSQIDLKVFKPFTAYNHIMFSEGGNTERHAHKPTVVDL
jgi:hypothetical protein